MIEKEMISPCAGSGKRISAILAIVECSECGMLIRQKDGVPAAGINMWALPEHAPVKPNCPLETGLRPCMCEDMPRCPICNYTEHDARFEGDHASCSGRIPDPDDVKEEIVECGRLTNHALVPGTGFCACTHTMYDEDVVLAGVPPDVVVQHCFSSAINGRPVRVFLDSGWPHFDDGFEVCLSRVQGAEILRLAARERYLAGLCSELTGPDGSPAIIKQRDWLAIALEGVLGLAESRVEDLEEIIQDRVDQKMLIPIDDQEALASARRKLELAREVLREVL